jgi:hypothetical protein
LDLVEEPKAAGAAEAEEQPQQPQQPRAKRAGTGAGEVTLSAWIAAERAAGRMPIPPTDTVFAYADDVGLPADMLALCWAEFRSRYTATDSPHGRRRYTDWRAVFRSAVRGNWLRLWWWDESAGIFALTTAGVQAKRARDEQAARATSGRPAQQIAQGINARPQEAAAA